MACAYLVVWGTGSSQAEPKQAVYLDHQRAMLAAAAQHGIIEGLVRESLVAEAISAAREEGYAEGLRAQGHGP
jgi:hypothetical protein